MRINTPILVCLVFLNVFFGIKLIQAIVQYNTSLPILLNPYTASFSHPAVQLKNEPKKIVGLASFYSNEGCLGCREDRKMANGQVFDEKKHTIAMNGVKLNTKVHIKSIKTGKTVIAVVTDTGGFGKLGRIADLSLATKEYINCNDLCQVEVTFLDK